MPKPWNASTIHFLTQQEMCGFFDPGVDLCFVDDWIGQASIKNMVVYAQLTSRRRDKEARKVFLSPYVA